ncbi:LamG domain-containing protein [Alteromonas aestuariivivens]|uniref:LamG domain-containing protein n=1 Tax=Alteromonas aestuariivivens TaxID=1938339 RepID=A0A3D8ME77_9ALTE|nr:LamG domain-containing protein [Alteromonas aestuariivivens]RDV28177.1 LamG domain-containing protein [Alteromonas aestuariivivens]
MLLRTSCLAAIALALLSGCGGSETEVTPTPLPPPTEQPVLNYSGPAPSTEDVSRFKQALWDNTATEDRCGACHVQGQQLPSFARNDDINAAYTDTGGLVNLSEPGESLLVQKVAGGHNCWLTSASACADIMTTWISNWANLADSGAQETEIELKAPVAQSPGTTRNFPESAAQFGTTVYPLLQNFCAGCHTSDASIPIAPYFASADIDEAYLAAKDRMNLDLPGSSRFVIRLRNEFHNCWSDCGSDATALENAIAEFADAIPLTELAAELVHSDALTLFDGTLASGGGRIESNVIAKWEFKTGSGNVAFDTSGVEPALNLTLSGDYSWVGGYGIQLLDGKAQGATSNSKKLYDQLVATGEFSVEAWVAPANVTQEGPARIISYSGGKDRRNFTLGQTLYNYDFLLRTGQTDINGEPVLSTPDADEVLQASLQHVVASYHPTRGRELYVNGELIDVSDSVAPGNLLDWDDSFALVLGSEVSGDFSWSGIIRMVAIHNRVLTQEQISKNFEAGIGQKYYLLFGIGDLIGTEQSYVVFEVSQYDSYSYLFAEPFFISLDAKASFDSFALEGMRIGLNGRESFAGQVFSRLATTVDAQAYTAGDGFALSRQGTIIPVEKGPAQDEFFLTFERLGEHENVVVEAEPAPTPAPADLAPQSQIGTRKFAEINATMSALTGVASSHTAVADSYETLRQQLPSVTGLESFVAANQMAITQLAIRYCDTLVEDNSLRSSYFPDFDFSQPPGVAFGAVNRTGVTGPLLERMLLSNLGSQADTTEVGVELDNLIDRLSACNGVASCDATYTRTITKASCAALLGSAVVLVQ